MSEMVSLLPVVLHHSLHEKRAWGPHIFRGHNRVTGTHRCINVREIALLAKRSFLFFILIVLGDLNPISELNGLSRSNHCHIVFSFSHNSIAIHAIFTTDNLFSLFFWGAEDV